MFANYTIGENDSFDIQRFPDLEQEIATMSQTVSKFRSLRKPDVVISYLKDHCVSVSWMTDNEELIKMLRSGRVIAKETEAFFTACRSNRQFLTDFERYMSSMLA